MIKTVRPPAALDVQVRALAKQHGFFAKPDLDSNLRLNVVFRTLQRVGEFQKTQAHARRVERQIEAAKGQTVRYAYRLAALSEETRRFLKKQHFHFQVLMDDLIDGCKDFEAVLDTALAPLRMDQRGRPPQKEVDFALREIIELYGIANPGTLSFSSDAVSYAGYKGRLFEFVCKLFDLFGIRRSPEAIGKRIQKAMEVKKRSVKKPDKQRKK